MKIKSERPKEPITLILELNRKEAMVLRAVFGSIVGLPRGPRGMMDNLEAHLETLGVPCALINSDNAICLPDTWLDVVPEDEV